MKKSNNVNHNSAGRVETSTQQPRKMLAIVGCKKSEESNDNSQRKFPSVDDVVLLLPQTVNMRDDREKLLKALKGALVSLIPTDNPNLSDPRLDAWLKADHPISTVRYDSAYRRETAIHLVRAYVEPIFAIRPVMKFWENFKSDFEKGADMSKYKPELVKKKWLREFYTLNRDQRYKFRGKMDEITQYHQSYNRFKPIYDKFAGISPLKADLPSQKEKEPDPHQDIVDMGLGDFIDSPQSDVNRMTLDVVTNDSDGLQTLSEEIGNIEVVKIDDERASVILMDKNKQELGAVEIFHSIPVLDAPPKEVQIQEPKVVTPIDVRSLIGKDFTVEISSKEAPENIVLYKYFPFWLIMLELALYLLSLYLIYFLVSIFPISWLYDVEEYLTPLSVVEQRLWEKNWFYVNWFLPVLQLVATFVYNPIAWVVQASLNLNVWLFSPLYYFVFVEWPQYYNLMYTRLDVLKDLYGEEAVLAEMAVVSSLIEKYWLFVLRSIVDLMSYTLWFNLAFILFFGNKYLTISDFDLIRRLKARRLTPTFLLSTQYLTMDFKPGPVREISTKEDLRPTTLKLCELAEKNYRTQTVSIVTSNVYGHSFDFWFSSYTGILSNYLWGDVEVSRSYSMTVLPDLLADVMDIKALTSLQGSEFQSRVKQVMSSSAHFNFDKTEMQELENLAMNTLIYGMALKKYDENKRLGNFPAGLWTISPAQSLS